VKHCFIIEAEQETVGYELTYSQKYWILGLHPSSGVLKLENTTYRKHTEILFSNFKEKTAVGRRWVDNIKMDLR
jgi:hypothetical protein